MKKIFSSLLMATMMISLIPLQSSASLVPGREPNPATVKAALAEFKSLSKQEKKQRIKDVKKELKVFKKEKKVAGRIPAVYVSSPVGVIGNTNLIALSDKRSVVEN